MSVCELCGLGLAEPHQHLIDPVNRRLVCACDACAILFDNPGAKFTRVPRDVRRLATPVFADAQWEALAIPIGMAFFFISKPLGRIVAMYPGPAGATESLLPLDVWSETVDGDSPIRSLRPDVEALLVNRVPRHRRETVSDVSDTPSDYIVPIDLCYQLVGLIRASWRGFSGGTEAWAAIDRFFADLEARAEPMSEVTRA
jgi:hypothetical protein